MGRPVMAQEAYQALDIPYHVRSVGMSGSGVGDVLGTDVSSLNPALLAGVGKKLIISAVRYPAVVRSQFAEWRTVWRNLSVATTFRGVNYGSFTERNRESEDLGSFSAGDVWLTAAVAKKITTLVDVGVSLGIFQSRVDEVDAMLGLVSLGGRVSIPQLETSLGVSIRNVGTTLRGYTTYDEPIPTSVAIGITRRLAHLPLTLSLDGIWWKERSLLRLGGEFSLPRGFHLQFGTTSRRSALQTGSVWRDIVSGVSLGVGYDLSQTSLGLAVANNGVGGSSLGFGFSRKF